MNQEVAELKWEVMYNGISGLGDWSKGRKEEKLGRSQLSQVKMLVVWNGPVAWLTKKMVDGSVSS